MKLLILVAFAITVLMAVAVTTEATSNDGWYWYDEDRLTTKNPTRKPTTTKQPRPTKTTKRPRPTRTTTSRHTTTSSSSSTTTTTTPKPINIGECVRNCPHTKQYNPVCGSNKQTFINREEYNCYLRCGLKGVEIISRSKCTT